MDVYVCAPDYACRSKLTTAASVVSSPFLVLSGLLLRCLNFLRELSLIGTSPVSRHHGKANTSAGFSLRRKLIWLAQECLLRQSFSLACSSGRISSGGTQHGMLSFVRNLSIDHFIGYLLTSLKFPCCLHSWPSLANQVNRVSIFRPYGIDLTNRSSDFLGQKLQCERKTHGLHSP